MRIDRQWQGPAGVLTPVTFIAVVALVAAGCAGGGSATSVGVRAKTAASTTTTSTTPKTGGGTVNSFAAVPRVARKLAPSVVTIQTADGLGSGVVWSADGLVVTDAHVVGTNHTVTVAFADGTQVNGTVQATDTVSDIAVVKADRSGITPAKFVTTLPALGDLAVVIGSPLGFTNSVTAGVISGEGREIPGSAAESQSLVDLIQTDAAVSPGNSGGALANGSAGVTGLVEAYIPPTQGAVSLGFAIPSATVVQVVKQLIATGKATHAYLGVATTAITPEIQQQLGLKESSGAAVQQVGAGSPAEKAGIQTGDVIVSFDGQPITSPEDLLAVLHKHQPGDQVQLTYSRNGTKHTVTVTLAERPSQ
jgi:S1-C subfamily serine protease